MLQSAGSLLRNPKLIPGSNLPFRSNIRRCLQSPPPCPSHDPIQNSVPRWQSCGSKGSVPLGLHLVGLGVRSHSAGWGPSADNPEKLKQMQKHRSKVTQRQRAWAAKELRTRARPFLNCHLGAPSAGCPGFLQRSSRCTALHASRDWKMSSGLSCPLCLEANEAGRGPSNPPLVQSAF